jgi:DNA topoisomerase-1
MEDYTKAQLKDMDNIENGKVEKKCPQCKEGNLVVRKSIYGAFIGCNKYPKCRYTEKIK